MGQRKATRTSARYSSSKPFYSGPPARLLCSPSGERDAANHGSSHLGSEDGRDQFNHLEERSRVRSPTITATSSLSISEPGFSISAVYSAGGRSGSADARFEGEYQSMRSAPCASAPSHPLHAMPPRITRNSDRPRASDRTMVNIVLLAASCTLDPCHQQQRNLMRMGQHAKPLQGSRNRVGWISRENLLRPRRSFFLDIPFYRAH